MKIPRELPRSARLAVPLAAAAIGLAAVWLPGRAENPGPIGFRLDDAWIHLVYGRGLLRDGFLAYAPGVPTTGCTSPLWAMVLAALHAIGGGRPGPDFIVAAVLTTGALLQIAATLTAGDLGRRLGGDATGLASGLLVAFATPWAAAAFSGMEVTLTGLLLLLAVRAAAGGTWRSAGVWLALAGLARPESAAVTLVLAGWAVGGARRAEKGAKGGDRAGGRGAAGRLANLLVPSAVAGAAFVGYDLWASGAPLPATFYAKSATSLGDLPRRLGVALTRMLPGVPPLAYGVGALALAGLFVPRRPGASGGPSRARIALPLGAGAAFLLANLALIDPVDPGAFYHLRYVLPAVPLLVVALAVAARRLGSVSRASVAPLAILLALGVGQAGLGARAISRHLHNDVRNINEVQRLLGERLGATLPAGTWIAASDAGAIRYFSDLPTVDVLGLNTPEMLAPDEEFLRSHPVAALVILPAWLRPIDGERLEPIFGAETERYTVTGNPAMATQIVLAARPIPATNGSGEGGDGSGTGSPSDARVRVRFAGYRRFALDFRPGAAMLRSPGRADP